MALKQKKVDILLISDSRISKDIEHLVKAQWGGDCVFASYTSAARGCAIFFNKNLPITIDYDSLEKENDGNFLSVNITYEGFKVAINCIYGPNADSPEFYTNKIFPIIERRLNEADFVVVGGDWNMVLDQQMDTFGYIGENNTAARDVVLNKCEDLGLVDIFREQNPDSKKYSWRARGKRSRLDFFLISSSLLPFVSNTDILPGVDSDHSIVQLDLDFSKFQKGRGFFKFNNSLCQDLEYVQLINKTIKNTCQQYAEDIYNPEYFDNVTPEQLFGLTYTLNDQLLFEMILLEIRGETIKYCAKRKKEKQAEKLLALHRLEIAEEQSDQNPNSETLQIELENAKNEINLFLSQENEGAACRARIKWNIEGEKGTKFFCNLEKRNATQKYIPELLVKRDDGEEVSLKEQKDIDLEITKYYSELYKNKDEELSGESIESFMENSENIKLTDEMSNSLEGLLTIAECTRYLKKCRNNASPGSSGFTGSFYKLFWRNISQFTVNALNFAYTHGELSVTQKLGIIVLLPKGSKDKRYLGNWRPISLLNTSLKILSGALAERIKPTLPHIIHEDQKGFVNGRYIGENIRNTFDILEYAKKKNKTGLLLSLDYEKAFDSISHGFIIKALKFFNYGFSFLKWINVLLNNISSCVNHCGHILERFNVGRGCRQGDPLSPYLYVICAEVLAIKIRHDKDINGFKINNKEKRLDMYADDTNIFLDGSEASLSKVLQILDSFFRLSGLKVNVGKSKAVWFGSHCNSEARLLPELGLVWAKNFTLLGVEFDNSLTNMERNVDGKLLEIEKVFKSWLYRDLSPFGKVAVIKSLALSKLSYIALVCPLKPNFEKKLTKLMFEFIWNNKPDKLKREYTYLPITQGGLKVPNIADFWKSLKFSWVRRLFTSSNIWKDILGDALKSMNANIDDIIYGGPDHLNGIAKKLTNPFWKETIKAVLDIQKELQWNKPEQFLEFNIFGNFQFRIGDSVITKNDFGMLWQRGLFQAGNFIHRTENGLHIFSKEEIERVYGLELNFLSYHRLSGALRNGINSVVGAQFDKIIMGQPWQPLIRSLAFKGLKGCSNFYNILRHREALQYGTGSAERKWAEVLGQHFTLESWDRVWKIHTESDVPNKTKWLQLQILRNILKTNYIVSKFQANISAACSFCNNAPENIVHLFWDCAKVKEFWSEATLFLNGALGPNQLTKRKVLFGDTTHSGKNIINLFILLGKDFIWKNKFTTRNLSMAHFKRFSKNAVLDVIRKRLKQNIFNQSEPGWQSIFDIYELQPNHLNELF